MSTSGWKWINDALEGMDEEGCGRRGGIESPLIVSRPRTGNYLGLGLAEKARGTFGDERPSSLAHLSNNANKGWPFGYDDLCRRARRNGGYPVGYGSVT